MNSKITTEQFDEMRIEKIKHHLESLIEKGKARYYEIFVDNLKVVEKTNDLEQFDDYKIYLDEKTKTLKLLLYSSCETSPRNDKFFFTFKKEESINALGEVEVQRKIESAINEAKEQFRIQSLEKELEQLKTELEEGTEYIEELEAIIEKLRTQKVDDSKQVKLGMVASIAIEELFKRNPNMVKNIPLIGALSGLAESESEMNTEVKTETKTTFAQTESQDPFLLFAKDLSKMFSTKELEDVIDILNYMHQDKTKIETVLELIKL
jgi:predicted Holliday junction resolvase-like endonuclease